MLPGIPTLAELVGGQVSASNELDPFLAEDPGLLASIGGVLGSGLSYAGEVLQKPSRILWALPSGKPEELLNLIPFSDAMGWSTPHDMAGLDVALERSGIIPENEPGFDWWDPVRFGANIAGDPMTYTGIPGISKALTVGGKIAEKAGILGNLAKVTPKGVGPRLGRMTTTLRNLVDNYPTALPDVLAAGGVQNLADLGSALDEPLGRLGRASIPFTGIEATFGEGPISQAIAGGLDKVGSAIRWSAPVRRLAQVFEPASGGRYDRYEQELAKMAHAGRPAAGAKAREAAVTALEQMHKLREDFHQAFTPTMQAEHAAALGQLTADEADDFLIRATEKVFDDLTRTVGELQGDVDRALEAVIPNVKASAAKVPVMITKAMRKKLADAGFTPDQIKNMTPGDAWQHLGGAPAPAGIDPTALGKVKTIATKIWANERGAFENYRDRGGWGEVLEAVNKQGHGSRYVDEKLLKDKQLEQLRGSRIAATETGVGLHRTPETANIPTIIVNRMLKDDALRAPVPKHTRPAIILQEYGKWLNPQWGAKADAAGNMVGGSIDEHAKAIAEWIAEHPQGDLFTRSRIADHATYMTRAHGAIKNLDAVHEMTRRHILPKSAGKLGTVSIRDAFSRLGAGPMKRAPKKATARAIKHFAKLIGKSPKEAAKMRIPANIASAIRGTTRAWQEPEWAEALGNGIITFNNWFKRAVTLPFPGFMFRNLTSGQHVNVSTGLVNNVQELAEYGAEFKRALGILKDPDAARDAVREMYINGVIGHGVGFEDVPIGNTTTGMYGMPANPLDFKATYGQVAADVAERQANNRFARGTGSIQRGYGTVVETGAKANAQVEFMNRAPLFLYLRKKGYSAAQAAKEVQARQFDYKDITHAERWIKQAIPFYIFTRKSIPLTIRSLLDRPGGPLAQSIRLTNEMRGEDVTTPDYVSQTASIPLGTQPGGDERYLTGFGLMHEVPLGYLGGGLQGGLLEGLSQLTPLAKAPLEWATGQSFFQRGVGGAGRPLEDLDPTIGRTISNVAGWDEAVDTPLPMEVALSNLPTSRFVSTARQLTDRRKSFGIKALGALTGARITDISPRAQEAVLRERAKMVMDELGAREFTKTYFSKEDIATSDPADAGVKTKFNALQALLARRARERAEAAKP